MTKVVHLTTVHRPRDVRIFYKEARSLARAGYEVVMIVPGDRTESVDNVRIQALPRPNGRLRRATLTQLLLLRSAIRENAALYHFHDPELIPTGVILRLLGRRVVYDVHEDLPRQIRHKPWIAPTLRGMVGRLSEIAEVLAAKSFSAVIAATPAIAVRFPKSKTVLVQNFPMTEEFPPLQPKARRQRHCRAYYAGGIEEVRGARSMVEALALVRDDCSATLVLAGEFSPPQLRQQLMELQGWSRVEFLGWKEREELRDVMASATIGLVPFHPLPNHVNAQPNKLFEYMAAGLPVIASDFPMWRQIVARANCGILVDPCCPRAIADAIAWLCDHPEEAREMGRRGYEAVQEQFNWESQARALLELYSQLD